MDDRSTEPIGISFDTAKRERILAERGIDIADAHMVFAETHVQVLDDRKDYGETRYRVFGFLHGRRVSAGLDTARRQPSDHHDKACAS